MCGGSYPTQFLADTIRGRQLVPIERAVQMLTDAPARLFGLRDRGRITRGALADLVLFDPATVGAEPACLVHDLPDGSVRMTAGSTGVDHVFVNGVETVVGGRATGDAGHRAAVGRDTEDVPLPQGADGR
jgi:N-acyl-D-aspartate/D-glutamate deacylase